MKLALTPKTIWLTAALASSGLLLTVLVVVVYNYFSPTSDFVVWPRDEAHQLKSQNQGALDRLDQTPAAEIADFDPKQDYFVGPANAKVKLIVYADFDCPFCKNFNPVLDDLAKLYPRDLTIIYRNFPVESHPAALGAANAWLCAAEQGKWREVKDALYDMTMKSTEKYAAMAQDLKLDQAKFKQCLTNKKYEDKILAQKAEAKAAGVGGTPTSFLNDIILPGAYKIEDFTDASGNTRKGLKSLINQQLAK